MAFADEFIAGAQAGQQVALGKIQKQKAIFDLKSQIENDPIERDILRHRLSELKLNERLQQRQAAFENLKALEGTPEESMTPDMTEGGVLPSITGPMAGVIQPTTPGSADAGPGALPQTTTQMRAVTIPGVDDSQPDLHIRPLSFQQTLAQQFAQNRIKALTDPYTLTATQGGTSARYVGNQKIGEVTGGEKMVPWKYRGKDLVMHQLLVPESFAATHPSSVDPVPRMSVNLAKPEDYDAYWQGMKTGKISSLTTGLKGSDVFQINLRAAKDQGYDLKKIQQDELAMRKFYSSLNSEDTVKTQQNADYAENALSSLQKAADDWKKYGGSGGAFSSAVLKAKAAGATGSQAKAAAQQLQTALADAQQAIAAVKVGGNNVGNVALANAAAALNAGRDLDSAIKQAESAIHNRATALRTATAILPSEQTAAPAGQPQITYDPTTGNFVSQ